MYFSYCPFITFYICFHVFKIFIAPDSHVFKIFCLFSLYRHLTLPLVLCIATLFSSISSLFSRHSCQSVIIGSPLVHYNSLLYTIVYTSAIRIRFRDGGDNNWISSISVFSEADFLSMSKCLATASVHLTLWMKPDVFPVILTSRDIPTWRSFERRLKNKCI